MATNFSENSKENNNKLYCKLCDYTCFKKQHLKQHELTKKHKKHIFNNVENSGNDTIKTTFICFCGKLYKDRSGLWKHKKICTEIENELFTPNCKNTS